MSITENICWFEPTIQVLFAFIQPLMLRPSQFTISYQTWMNDGVLSEERGSVEHGTLLRSLANENIHSDIFLILSDYLPHLMDNVLLTFR